MSLVLIILFGLSAGILIGVAGIGGVILVPLLVYVTGFDVHVSVAAAVTSFLVSGLIGTFSYSRRGVINWSQLMYLTFGSIPGALLGAFALSKVNANSLILFIAIILIFTSFKQIANLNFLPPSNQRSLPNLKLVLVGFLTGGLSVLSGTGGPLVLVPVLTFLSVPIIAVIGLSQAIQVPIAVFATIGNGLVGLIRWEIVLPLSFGLAIGTFVGATASKYLPVVKIKNLVAFLLLASGLYMLANLFFL